MPIVFACGCGKQLKTVEENAGKRVKCPACGQPVPVPQAKPVAAAPPPKAAAKAPTGDILRFACECGKQLQARPEMAGKRVKCPACGNELAVPGPNGAPAKPAAKKPDLAVATTPKPKIHEPPPEPAEDEGDFDQMPAVTKKKPVKKSSALPLLIGLAAAFLNYDVLTGKDVWKRDFPAGSIPLRVEQAELAGAIDPDGKLLVLNARDGKEVLKAALDRKHLQKPDAVQLLRDRWQYYVLIDGPEGKEKLPAGVWPLVTPDSGLRTLAVNGEVYALSPDGEVSWSASVAHQALLLNQFDELPLLAFAARRTQLVNGQAVQRAVTTIIAKHSGKLLYDSEMTPISPFHALTLDPRTGRVELLGHSLRLTHTAEREK